LQVVGGRRQADRRDREGERRDRVRVQRLSQHEGRERESARSPGGAADRDAGPGLGQPYHLPADQVLQVGRPEPLRVGLAAPLHRARLHERRGEARDGRQGDLQEAGHRLLTWCPSAGPGPRSPFNGPLTGHCVDARPPPHTHRHTDTHTHARARARAYFPRLSAQDTSATALDNRETQSQGFSLVPAPKGFFQLRPAQPRLSNSPREIHPIRS
jgi:hypothetical protein